MDFTNMKLGDYVTIKCGAHLTYQESHQVDGLRWCFGKSPVTQWNLEGRYLNHVSPPFKNGDFDIISVFRHAQFAEAPHKSTHHVCGGIKIGGHKHECE